MTNSKKYITAFFTVFILLILAGCQTLQVRGQFVSDTAIKEINANKLNKNKIIGMVGTPTYVPDYTDNTWYYIQRSLKKRVWLDPKIVDQRIVKITFNSKGDAKEAVLLSNMQNEAISVNSDYTKTQGTEQTSIQKFVKNIGRFNPSTSGSNRRKKKK